MSENITTPLMKMQLVQQLQSHAALSQSTAQQTSVHYLGENISCLQHARDASAHCSNQPGKCTPDLSCELINTKGKEDWEDHEHNLRIIQIKLINRVQSSLLIMRKYKANFYFYQKFNSEIPETADRTPRMLRTFKTAKGTSSNCSVYMSF